MEISQKKMIAGIGIYEVLLVTFVFIFEPYGRRMSSSEWTNFWTWFFVVPIAAILIFYLFIWGSGKNIKLIFMGIMLRFCWKMSRILLN